MSAIYVPTVAFIYIPPMYQQYQEHFSDIWEKPETSWAELGQVHLQLELEFTLINVWLLPLTCILACLLAFLLAYFLFYIPAYKGDQTVLYYQLIPNTPNHTLAIHLISTNYT